MQISLPLMSDALIGSSDAVDRLLEALPAAARWLSEEVGSRCTWWTGGSLGLVDEVRFARLDEQPLDVAASTVARLRERIAYYSDCPAAAVDVRP